MCTENKSDKRNPFILLIQRKINRFNSRRELCVFLVFLCIQICVIAIYRKCSVNKFIFQLKFDFDLKIKISSCTLWLYLFFLKLKSVHRSITGKLWSNYEKRKFWPRITLVSSTRMCLFVSLILNKFRVNLRFFLFMFTWPKTKLVHFENGHRFPPDLLVFYNK